MKPASQLSNEELLEGIKTLSSEAYRALSKFHRTRLDELMAEAKKRKIKK